MDDGPPKVEVAGHPGIQRSREDTIHQDKTRKSQLRTEGLQPKNEISRHSSRPSRPSRPESGSRKGSKKGERSHVLTLLKQRVTGNQTQLWPETLRPGPKTLHGVRKPKDQSETKTDSQRPQQFALRTFNFDNTNSERAARNSSETRAHLELNLSTAGQEPRRASLPQPIHTSFLKSRGNTRDHPRYVTCSQQQQTTRDIIQVRSSYQKEKRGLSIGNTTTTTARDVADVLVAPTTTTRQDAMKSEPSQINSRLKRLAASPQLIKVQPSTSSTTPASTVTAATHRKLSTDIDAGVAETNVAAAKSTSLSRNSSIALMEQFLHEMDQVFNILRDENNFRHSVHSASETSSLDRTPSTSLMFCESNAPSPYHHHHHHHHPQHHQSTIPLQDLYPNETGSRSDRAPMDAGIDARLTLQRSQQLEREQLVGTFPVIDDVQSPTILESNTRPTVNGSNISNGGRIVVPLAMLEEFSSGGGGCSIDDLDDDDDDDDSLSLENARSTRHTPRDGGVKHSATITTTVSLSRLAETDDFNISSSSTARTATAAAAAVGDSQRPPLTYEQLELSFIGQSDEGMEVGHSSSSNEIFPSVHPLRPFAERYFNVHLINSGYPTAISKTFSFVTRRSFVQIVQLEDLLRYTKNPILATSLVRFMDTDNVPLACSVFKEIHKYMRGETKSDLIHSTLSDVVSLGIKHLEMRDEILCQLCRLMTDNPGGETPLYRLWVLMLLCLLAFHPSKSLHKPLMVFIKRAMETSMKTSTSSTPPSPASSSSRSPSTTPPGASKLCRYAKTCLKIISTPKRYRRKFPPSTTEIEAVTSLQPIQYRIHFLDGKTKTVALNPEDVAADAVLKVAEKIGLRIPSGWAIYESVPENDRYVKDNECLADILAEWEMKQTSVEKVPPVHLFFRKQKVISSLGASRKGSPSKAAAAAAAVAATTAAATIAPRGHLQVYGKLVLFKRFCRRTSDDVDEEDDVELRLLFAQAVHYVVHLDEFQAPQSIAFHLAGLQAQAEFGNFNENKLERYSDPNEMLCQRIISAAASRDFSSELASVHKRYGRDKTPKEAMIKYLIVVSQFPLYGCTKLLTHYLGSWQFGTETVLAVNFDGVKIISIQEKKIIYDLFFSEIESFRIGGHDDSSCKSLLDADDVGDLSEAVTSSSKLGKRHRQYLRHLRHQHHHYHQHHHNFFSSFSSLFHHSFWSPFSSSFFSSSSPSSSSSSSHHHHRQNHLLIRLKDTLPQARQKTFLFECLELDEFAELIEFYSPRHAVWKFGKPDLFGDDSDRDVAAVETPAAAASASAVDDDDHSKVCVGGEDGEQKGNGYDDLEDDDDDDEEIRELRVTSDWHALYDNILKCRRLLVQRGIVKKPPAEEVGFIRAALNRISGRATCIFSRHHHQTSSGDNRRQRSQEVDGDESLSSCSLLSPYWLFSRCPFRTSLLANQPHEVEDTAVRMFNSTLVYTGLELSAALDDMDLVVVVQTLITKCMENLNLCNEYYLQLIKQTTDNKMGPEHKNKNQITIDSNVKALDQYWHLMTMATCVMLPPDPIVFSYLNLHLHRALVQSCAESAKFAKFCIKSLKRTQENQGRRYPPSYKEILFVTKRQPIECRVYLSDGHPVLVAFDSASSADEVMEIVKAKSGIRMDAFGFALFHCMQDKEEYIPAETKMADCLYQWERCHRGNQTPGKDLKILFKKRLFIEPFFDPNDPIEIDLLYHQSVTDVFDQKIPLTKFDAVQLCALRAQAESSDYNPSNNFDYNSVVRILPRHLRDLMVLKEISTAHQLLAGTSPLTSNTQFLEILMQWPLYGSLLFEVLHGGIEGLPKNIWIAVSQIGVHLMEFQGQKVFSTHLYDDIASTEFNNKSFTLNLIDPGDTGDTKQEQLQKTPSTTSLSSAMTFFTSEGQQISQLISDYREVLAQRRIKKPSSRHGDTSIHEAAVNDFFGDRTKVEHRRRAFHQRRGISMIEGSAMTGSRQDDKKSSKAAAATKASHAAPAFAVFQSLAILEHENDDREGDEEEEDEDDDGDDDDSIPLQQPSQQQLKRHQRRKGQQQQQGRHHHHHRHQQHHQQQDKTVVRKDTKASKEIPVQHGVDG